MELLLLFIVGPAAALPKRLFLHTAVCVHCACTPLYKTREKPLLQMSFGNDYYWRCLGNIFFYTHCLQEQDKYC